MVIDEFIWLPSIVEKLETKHHVTQDEAEEVFLTVPDIVSLNRDVKRVKMFIRQRDKRIRVVI
jgi:hypothetical protein